MLLKPAGLRSKNFVFCVLSQVTGASIVGVSQGPGSVIQIWHMPLRGGKTDKPTRRLLKSAPIKLAEHDAKAVVQGIRSRCCWGGQAQPRRLLVIINPTSGPGRCVEGSCGSCVV